MNFELVSSEMQPAASTEICRSRSSGRMATARFRSAVGVRAGSGIGIALTGRFRSTVATIVLKIYRGIMAEPAPARKWRVFGEGRLMLMCRSAMGRRLVAAKPLDGQIALVTGAAKRIGRSIALRL